MHFCVRLHFTGRTWRVLERWVESSGRLNGSVREVLRLFSELWGDRGSLLSSCCSWLYVADMLLLTSSCVQTMLPPPINQNNPCSKKISSFPSLCESFLAVGLYCYPTDSSTGSALRANSSACLGTGIQRNCPGCFAAMPVYHEMVFWWCDSPVTVSAVAAV